MGTEIRTVNQTLATCLLCQGEVFRAESRRLFSISSGGAGIAPCSPLLLHFQVGHAPVGYFPLLVYLTTCLIRDNWQLLHLTHELCEINILHTATLVSFQNLKYHQWWCYHICMLRTNSSRGNISLHTTGHGCHLQDFFTISCFSINVSSTHIANCNLVSETLRRALPRAEGTVYNSGCVPATSRDQPLTTASCTISLYSTHNISLLECLVSHSLTVF